MQTAQSYAFVHICKTHRWDVTHNRLKSIVCKLQFEFYNYIAQNVEAIWKQAHY